MNDDIRFALYSIKKNIQGSAELRTSFLMNIFGMALNDIVFIVLWTFFIRSVGVIGGWTSADIIGLMGFCTFSYGVVMSFFYGVFKLPDYVAAGSFDRFMLSPKNLLFRVATSAILPAAVGDMLFGAVCLVIYAFSIHIGLSQFFILLLLAGTVCLIFLAILIIIFSTSFLFADANTVTNSLFNLFLGPSLFHGGAFQGIMRFVFTFIIPSLLIGGLPVEALKNTSWPTLTLIIMLAVVFSALSIYIFYKAIKKYESSSFMTFGN